MKRVGFLTDTSICIGCKACEVACKEWNDVPAHGVRATQAGNGVRATQAGDGVRATQAGDGVRATQAGDGFGFLGLSYDNTGSLGADTWRHVAFVEQTRGDGDVRWLMSSDVCKHCTSAACLDVCPTGSLFRTEFGSVVVQADVCNGCGYCIPACPFGVIDQRKGDGRAWKCTLCYDRLKGGLEPACSTACPTQSIQFGELDELRARARERLDRLHEDGVTEARLYGDDPADGVDGMGAFFLLLDEPEVYGLPSDPVVTTRDLARMWKAAAVAGGALVAGVAAAFVRR